MLHATLFAPIFAVISAFTVSTQMEVPIERISIPVVVYGTGVSELHDGHVMDFGGKDVTPGQIEAVRERLIAAGFASDHLEMWTQLSKTFLGRETPLSVGVIMIDLGTPAEARTIAPRLATLQGRDLGFAWNQYVAVDCAAMDRQLTSQLRALVSEPIRSMTSTTDPRTGTFDPIPLCSGAQHPIIRSAGGRPPIYITDTFMRHASANVEVAQASSTAPIALPQTTSVFPYSTFGFPSPIIGHQNRAYVLRGGRFAATPGASEISAIVDAALAVHTYTDANAYATAARALAQAGIAEADYAADANAKELDIRISGVTQAQWTALEPLVTGANVYRFLKNCAPYDDYARAVALDRSHRLAASAAQVLNTAVGPLVVATDWAGPATDAICGSDGSGDLATLIAYAKSTQRYNSNEPFHAWFTASLYAAWTLGARPPSIASQAIADRLDPVVRSDQSGTMVTGTATIVPDAYFFNQRQNDPFVTTFVASRADVPKDRGAGNVVTDCETAQEQALANAVKVALLDRPFASFVADPARYLSIACLPKEAIGQTSATFPTMYTDNSPTGAAQVTQTITVYPASPPAHR